VGRGRGGVRGMIHMGGRGTVGRVGEGMEEWSWKVSQSEEREGKVW